MRLRNKKTGEIFDWRDEIMPYGLGLPHPKTLAELNEEWEDYKPAEPLIKDKKIRRVVKTWAELNAIKRVVYVEYESLDGSYYCLVNMHDGRISIKFAGCISALKDCEEYTIDELCGEEEE